jgi:hypothetical protein
MDLALQVVQLEAAPAHLVPGHRQVFLACVCEAMGAQVKQLQSRTVEPGTKLVVAICYRCLFRCRIARSDVPGCARDDRSMNPEVPRESLQL